MTDWKKAAEEFIGNLPSPNAPSIKNKDYPTAVKLATYTKDKGIATAQEAEGFWQEFSGMNEALVQQGKQPYSPQDYKSALDQLSPLSHTYHGRAPTMREIATYGQEHPTKQRDYYASLPDSLYPHITAGQMVQAKFAANPHAQQNVGREPVKSELAYLVHSKEDPSTYYSNLAPEQEPEENAVQTQTGGNQGVGSPQAPRGQQTQQ